MPVRLMTMHQAKGREMDAILIVHHADDYIPDLDKFSRVMFVAASRARRVVSIQLNPTPLPAYAGVAALEKSAEF
jgi:superfamily I DNA/RNA helicase